MRIPSFAVLFIAAAFGASALAQETPASTAKVEVDELSFDFGYIPSGAVVGHSYTLRSQGTDSLKILGVKPGCGCTKAPLKKEVVAAGDSTTVELIYTSNKAANGRFSKSATVTTNDKDRASFALSFKGKAYEHADSLTPLTLSMSEISFSEQNKSKEAKLTVKNVSAEPVGLQLVSLSSEFISVEIPRSEIKPGQSREIKVKLNSALPEDQFQKSFTFAVSDKDGSRYTIPVSLNKASVAKH